MKHIKKFSLYALILALLFTLTACGLTPEKAVDRMNEALAQSQPTKATVEMTAEFSMNAYGTPVEMKMDATANALFSADPFRLYADVTLDTKTSTNAQETYTLKLYGLMEDGKPVFYAYNVAGDTWSKSPLETADASLPTATTAIFPDSSLVELTENVSLPSGTTAHRLTYTVDGSMVEGMEDAFAALGDTIDVSQLDMSSLRIPMDVYLDPETFLPLQMDVSLEGFDSFVQSILNTALGNEFKFEVKELGFSVTALEYGEQRIPQLPEEAPLYIEILSHEADQGDGTYVLRSPYDAVKITCPDGWHVEGYDYYYVSLIRDDGYRAAVFSMQEKASVKDTGLYLVNLMIDDLKVSELYHSDGRGEKSGDYELAWIRQSNGIFNAYGWKHLSDNTLLLIEVIDGTATYNAKNLISSASELVETVTTP